MALKIPYKERITGFRATTKEKELLRDLDFVETTLEWVQGFFDVGKFSVPEFNLLKPMLFRKTFQAFKMVAKIEKLGPDEFDFVEKTMLLEGRILINTVIETGKVEQEDFNLLQVNLQSILVKFSMIEEARMALHDRIEREKKQRQAEEAREKQDIALMQSFDAMPLEEKRSFLYNQFFEFVPSARTHEERLAAIAANRRTVEIGRKKIAGFKQKVAVAIAESRSKAGKDIGEISAVNQFYVLTKAKVEKQRFKGEEEKARQRVLQRQRELKEFIEERGFAKMVGEARQMVSDARTGIVEHVGEEEKLFSDAREMIGEKRQDLEQAEEKEREYIMERVKEEKNKGKKFVERVKGHLKEEQEGAEQLFDSAERYLQYGREHLESERKGFEQARNKGRQRIATEKKRLRDWEKKAVERKEKEEQRVAKEEKKLGQRIEKEKQMMESLRKKLESIGQEVRGRAGKETQRISQQKAGISETSAQIGWLKKDHKGKKVTPAGAASAQTGERIKNFAVKVEKTKSDLQHKKDLLAYDVRFTKDRLKKTALKVKEHVDEQFEGFEERQRTLIARLRAKQKAKMIRTLSRTMRAMH